MKPEISIVMPAKDRGDTISESIESILSQSFQNFELIIIDDGSSDNTLEIAKKYESDPRVKVLSNTTNRGIAFSRNRGVGESASDLIAVADSDDVWIDREKLSKQILFLKKNTDVVVLGTQATIHFPDGKTINTRHKISDKEIRKKMIVTQQFTNSSVVYKKYAWQRVSGYDERYKVADDFDFLLKLGQVGKYANLNFMGVLYRKDGKGVSHKKNMLVAKENLIIVLKHNKNYKKSYIAIGKCLLRFALALLRIK